MQSQTRGYSLVELLVSASVVVTLSAISFPSVATSLETYRLRNDTRRLVAQCQNARFLAISSNVSHRLHLNGRTIEIQKRSGGSYTTVESFPLSPSIHPVSTWASDPVFTPRGSVSPAASITLRNRNGQQRTVSISVIGRATEQ